MDRVDWQTVGLCVGWVVLMGVWLLSLPHGM